MLNRRQSGQALVGVLVVTVLIFLLAGAVSIGVASLLARMRTTGSDITNDFAVQSAVAAAASASQTSACAPGKPSFFKFAQPSASPQSGFCAGLDKVPSTPLTSKDLAPWSSHCSATDLTAGFPGSTRFWIVFGARWLGLNTSANVYRVPVSNSTPCNPGISIGNPVCPGANNPAGGYPIALSCSVPTNLSTDHLYLVIRNMADQPTQAFFISSTASSIATSGGLLYTTVTPTGLPPPADYEEAVFYLPSTAAQLKLLYEARLP